MKLFDFDPRNLPGCSCESRAKVGWERFQDAIKGDQASKSFAAALDEDPVGRKLAHAIFGNSPFLSACWRLDPPFTRELLELGPDIMAQRTLSAVHAMDHPQNTGNDLAALQRGLRVQKRRIALITAIADITGLWDLQRITHTLSDFAAAAVSAAAAYQLLKLHETGKIKLKHPDDPQRLSGLIILAMGKLGGRELNYSSDIDLIVLYDTARVATDDPQGLQHSFVRLTRGLVTILEDRTQDGYVFRIDLRLRPDPSSTPLAVSCHAAELYYESIGQNWERAAMIKARPIAGDRLAGTEFLHILKPFVWRKSLDFDTIRDIQSIKRQINAQRGGSKIKLLGHNVKLGRGGIREIEFYAQTQQLIWGGRNANVRSKSTLEALNELAEAKLDAPEHARILSDAYMFLRRVEHRLQMVDDAQTHVLPTTQEGIDMIATFLGYHSTEAFAHEILEVLGRVETLYAQLFEDKKTLGAEGSGGNLVFTGGESDPETLNTLREMGYRNAEAVDGVVRGWHHGRYRAMRSTRARQLLTELLPRILAAMAVTADPDQAILRFDGFLSQLPAGVQVFSLFQSNPHIFELIAEIMGTAPRLADHLAKKSGILDAVLLPGFLDSLPSDRQMHAQLVEDLSAATHMEDILDITRRWAKDRKFQVGTQILRGTIKEQESQRALSDIAEIALKVLHERVEGDFIEHHGRVPGGALCVVAFGKLGGREKTPTSDMDLIFIYDCDESATVSDGQKPLAISQYFARLAQRLINALSAQTAEGALYEVDMRLRPSGNAGPIASSLDAFKKYQKKDAWTWEHMALTRARVVSGAPRLKVQIENVIMKTLCRQRDPGKLAVDVADMRMRMDKEHHTEIPWAIKTYRGGLVDIEFMAQYLQLCHAHTHPKVLSPTTHVALQNLKDAQFLDTATADSLIEALNLWQSVQGLLRLTMTQKQLNQDTEAMPESLKCRLSYLCSTPDIVTARQKIVSTAAAVMDVFSRLIDVPAERARAHVTSDLQR